jgi:hypothetical protein
LVVNPSFEEGQAAWIPYSPDLCYVTSADSLSGLNSLECRNPGPAHKQQGLKQSILLNQDAAQPILISGMKVFVLSCRITDMLLGYSKSEIVAGTIPIFYGVYAEVRYEDGSTLPTSALFFEGKVNA